MDLTVLSEFVGNIGFPIVIALIMVNNSNNNVTAYTELYHKLKESVDNNSKLINELIGDLRNQNNKGGD